MQSLMLFRAACKAQCFDKNGSSVNNAPLKRSGSFAVTESSTRKPADSDAPQPPANGDGRTDSGERPGTAPKTEESGGPNGLEPTRYGDWERNGRCTDF